MQAYALICVIGVSGAGKSTMQAELCTKHPEIYHEPVSATTRAMRPGEVNGVNYHFLSRDEFQKWIRDGKLAEHAEFNGNFYGTPLAELQVPGKIALHVVEDQGARNLKRVVGAHIVGVLLADAQHQEARLGARGDSPEAIKERLAADRHRVKVIKDLSDLLIVNERLEQAVGELDAYGRSLLSEATA